MNYRETVVGIRNYTETDGKGNTKNCTRRRGGSVSDLLVVRTGCFVFSLESQEINLAQFQEQVPHIKQPARFSLYSLDCSVG